MGLTLTEIPELVSSITLDCESLSSMESLSALISSYHEIDYIKIDTGHGDYLCADVMEKKLEGDNE